VAATFSENVMKIVHKEMDSSSPYPYCGKEENRRKKYSQETSKKPKQQERSGVQLARRQQDKGGKRRILSTSRKTKQGHKRGKRTTWHTRTAEGAYIGDKKGQHQG